MILNRVTDVYLLDADGNRRELEDDKLYRVVADLYSGQMLSAVTKTSYGLLSVVPKKADGTPIENFEDVILTDNGGGIKGMDGDRTLYGVVPWMKMEMELRIFHNIMPDCMKEKW